MEIFSSKKRRIGPRLFISITRDELGSEEPRARPEGARPPQEPGWAQPNLGPPQEIGRAQRARSSHIY